VLLQRKEDAAVAAVVTRSAARAAGFDGHGAAEIATAAAELAANVVRHGGGGTLWVWRAPDRLSLLCVDRGRAPLDNTERLMRAADSSADHGLGAVRRLMDGVQFVVLPGGGLSVLVWRLVKRRSR
jgi:anti-sigma regulatory factor (Ser/Thr protein kinase)